MYGIEEGFWLKLIVVVAVFFLLVFLFDEMMRRVLKVEKQKRYFSYNYVNAKHKKMDWIIRSTGIIVLVVWYVVDLVLRLTTNVTGFFQAWLIIFLFLFVSETTRAIMERKYADHPNDYKLTISVMLFFYY